MNMIKKFAAVLAATAVASVSVAAISVSAMESAESAPYTASLCIQAGADTQWNPGELGGTDATITGDGSYTASVIMNNGSASLELLLLETNINAYAFAPETCSDPIAEGTVKFTIDSVTVKQVSGSTVTWDYKGPSDGAFRTSDDGKNIRFNIWNTWTKPPVSDFNGATDEKGGFLPDGGLASGDEVVVSFTVSGLGVEGAAVDDTATTTTAAPSGDGGETTTTAVAVTDANGNTVATTTAAGNNSGNSSNNTSSGGSSSKGNTSSGTGSNATTSQTGDFGIAAIVLGAVATAALGVGAYTVTKKRK